MVATRLERICSSQNIWWIAVLTAGLLSLPTLTVGLALDDYQQRIALLGGGGNVFEFIHWGTSLTKSQLESGIWPWWTYPGSKVVFYRPLAQWLMKADYALWPNQLELMHLHSVLWYGAVVFLGGLLYRRMMPTPFSAGLGALLFAVDAFHGDAVSWLANRNVLLGLTATLPALLFYQRKRWYSHLAGSALLAVGLACTESALAITAYFVAFEACLSQRSLLQRLLRLLPYAVVALGWLAFWRLHGYGTAGPGFYVDPGTDPAGFALALIYRYPAYLVGQIMPPPVEIFGLWDDHWPHALALTYALLALGLLGYVLWPLLRDSRLARFYAVGMLISAIPICASQLVSRSLWYVGFGAIGLLALVIERWLSFRGPDIGSSIRRLFAQAMLLLHLWLSPLLFIAYGQLVSVLDSAMDTQRLKLPDEGPGGKRVLVLSVPNYFADISFPLLKDKALSMPPSPRRPPPSITRVRVLAESESDFELKRTGDDTLLLDCSTGLTALRPRRYRFAVGDTVVLDDMRAVVNAVNADGAPTEVEYHFARGALATYEVLAWDKGGFVSFKLPEVGRQVRVNNTNVSA